MKEVNRIKLTDKQPCDIGKLIIKTDSHKNLKYANRKVKLNKFIK